MSDTVYQPKPDIAAHAQIGSMESYRTLYEKSVASPGDFWNKHAQGITFFQPYDTVVEEDFETAGFSWFVGGKLNACYNCVDRHVEERGDQTAIIWAADEPGQYQHISYKDLRDQVSRMANVLTHIGVRKGDRVCFYMPMIPELAYGMLACARIGAIHSVVFAGFSADSLRDRIIDADCRVVLTANEGLRGGKTIPLKQTVDAAVDGLGVNTVLVKRRTDTEVSMREGRDLWLDEEMLKQRPFAPVEWMDSEAPLFILYTSGSTGKPKGLMHTTAGYMVFTSLTHSLIFDYHDGDIYCCAADIGWITGHSYIVYGPLANGATTVMFESVPTYPDASRYWQMVDDLKINIFYTAPTALRAIHRFGDDMVTRHSRQSLRVLGTVGEPINPEVWEWYHDVVGSGRCTIVDTWWQTETGGILITPLPGAIPTKPGSATLPFFGVQPVLVNDEGKVLEGNDVRGNLCIKASWPGIARTIWGDHARFVETYFTKYKGLYFTSDGCRRDQDGYYWITGRVDDVLNVSGHRLGTAEIESALVAHEAVAEAAVVGMPHDIKGTGIYAFVLPKGDVAAANNQETIEILKQQVRKVIGPIAIPDRIQVVSGLPKTRSGKIMRRILRKVAVGEYDDLGDITTLAEPAVVEQIVAGHRDGR
jgi:acetyl-CoA synthetase